MVGGPNGFTITTHDIAVKPGGVWRFIMHGPWPRFHVTVTFEAEGAKTWIRMRSLFESAAERDRVVKEFRAIDGMNQTLDRLGQHLATLAA